MAIHLSFTKCQKSEILICKNNYTEKEFQIYINFLLELFFSKIFNNIIEDTTWIYLSGTY
jgi:hypothetical protein